MLFIVNQNCAFALIGFLAHSQKKNKPHSSNVTDQPTLFFFQTSGSLAYGRLQHQEYQKRVNEPTFATTTIRHYYNSYQDVVRSSGNLIN